MFQGGGIVADKAVEFKCLQKVISGLKPKGDTAKTIYTILNNATLISDEEQECPDFILQQQDTVIGLEHFLVDVLINKDGSNARRVSKHRQQILHSLGCKPSQKTLKQINEYPIVHKQLEKGIFDEHFFLKEFQRVARKHSNSCNGYLGALHQYPAKKYLMGVIIEMPCQTNGRFILYDSSGKQKERILNCVPLTQNLLSMMKRILKDFDFVVILTETLLNELPQDSKVYCFWQNNYEVAIKEQRIPLCTSFSIRTEDV